MTYEFIESQCKITVDGHLLFFDLEGLEALDKPSTTLHLYKVCTFFDNISCKCVKVGKPHPRSR